MPSSSIPFIPLCNILDVKSQEMRRIWISLSPKKEVSRFSAWSILNGAAKETYTGPVSKCEQNYASSRVSNSCPGLPNGNICLVSWDVHMRAHTRPISISGLVPPV